MQKLIDNIVQKIEQDTHRSMPSFVPIGAAIVNIHTEQILTFSTNSSSKKNKIAHAEIVCLQKFFKKNPELLGGKSLLQTDIAIFVTVEPCPMCFHAISLFGIKNVIFGAYRNTDFYMPQNIPNIIGGVCETSCAKLCKNFFSNRR